MQLGVVTAGRCQPRLMAIFTPTCCAIVGLTGSVPSADLGWDLRLYVPSSFAQILVKCPGITGIEVIVMALTVEKPSEVGASPLVETPSLRPLRSRYIIAGLLPVVAIMAVVGWSFAIWSWKEQSYLNMPEHTLPSVVTLNGRPGPYWIYGQGTTNVARVRVTDANGRVIPVQMLKPRAIENYGGLSPKEIARFEAVQRIGPTGPVPLRVEVTGSGEIRIGERSEAFPGPERWGMAALLVVNVGAAIAVIVVPIVRRRRHRTA